MVNMGPRGGWSASGGGYVPATERTTLDTPPNLTWYNGTVIECEGDEKTFSTQSIGAVLSLVRNLKDGDSITINRETPAGWQAGKTVI